MIQQNFKAPIALMMKIYGKQDDELINIYWNLFKNIEDVLFEDICEEIIKTFIPTSQVPFPTPAHFENAKNKIQNMNELYKNEPAYFLEYKGPPPLSLQEQKEHDKMMADFFRDLAKEIKKNPNRHVLNNLFD